MCAQWGRDMTPQDDGRDVTGTVTGLERGIEVGGSAMPSPLEFMRRVVAWPADGESGWVNLHFTVPNRKGLRGKPYPDADAFITQAQWCATNPDKAADVYFCLSRQSQTETKPGRGGVPWIVAKREAIYATHLKAIWLDVDVKEKKGYATLDEARAAMADFVKNANLPPPSAIVLSGGGLHVYWISTVPLTRAEWEPYAWGLRAEAVRCNLKCDAGLTTDAARVLRVPGTFNFKSDPARPVRLMGMGPDIDFGLELADLANRGRSARATGGTGLGGGGDSAVVTAAVIDLTGFQGGMDPAFAGLDPTSENLSDGLAFDDTPLDPTPIFAKDGCPLLRQTLLTGGKDQPQGLWNLVMLATVFMVNGEPIAHNCSKGYDGYTPAETQEMFERKKGERARGLRWPGCGAFENEAPTACAACPHRGKIKSPLNLVTPPTPAAETAFVDPYSDFAGPPFPLDVLPPTLSNFVDTEHRAMGADASAIAMAALTAVAGAMHAETSVRVGEGWWERPILWTALVGQPSTMKSPIIDKVKAPLSRIDHERKKRWDQQAALCRQNQTKAAKAPLPHRPARCIMNDVTPEKVAEILSREPSGSLLVYDELAGWLGGFERYSSGQSNRAFYLSCWNGGPSLKDRVGKGRGDQDAEISVDNLALCVLGGVQPDRLEKIGDLTSDGMLQRFIPVLMAPAERGNEYHPVEAAEVEYDRLIRTISAAPPQKYHFANDALEIRDRVIDYLHNLEKVDGFGPALIGAVGKMKGYFGRLCLVLEAARQHDPVSDARHIRSTLSDFDLEKFAPEEGAKLAELLGVDPNEGLAQGLGTRTAISRQTAEDVEKMLREFLLPHIFGLYDAVVNGGQDRDMVRSIGRFILASDKDRLRPSDITAGLRSLRGLPEPKIREWMGRFYAMGWLQPEEDKPGVPPKAWVVVSGLRGHFAERRTQAQRARAEAHAILRAGGSRKRT